MRIDNTAFTMYMRCPRMYRERYERDPNGLGVQLCKAESVLGNNVQSGPSGHGSGVQPVQRAPTGIELAGPKPDLDFGSRFHQLVEHRRLLRLSQNVAASELQLRLRKLEQPWPNDDIEREAQFTFAQYEAHYLPEPLEFLEAEKTHTIPIPGTPHELTVKIDGVVRHADGTIGPLDTKTERSGSQNNTREAWAGRTQASLYLWALKALYPEERVSRLVVDVVTRGTPKKLPLFTRLDDIARPQAALDDAIRNVVWVCDDIERSRQSGFWRSNMNICKDGWKRCDYYDLHVYGETAENLQKFQAAEAYLDV